jgi:acetolactate synthase-1/2/3 large subunit
LLELPDDVATAEINEGRARQVVPGRGFRTGPDPVDVSRAVDLLLGSQHPLLVVGQGVQAAEAWEELREFAELLRLPVMTSMGGKSAFAENHPLSLGVGGLTTTAMVDHFLRRADLIFAVGSSLTRWWMFAPLPSNCAVVQSTVDERDLNKDAPLEHAVIGDAKLVLSAMTTEAKRRLEQASPALNDPSGEIAAVRARWLADWMPKLTSGEVPINPYRVIWELMRTVDRERTIITHDSGSPRDQLAPFYEAVMPRGYVGWGHSTQLGYSLGLAMGMKLARPDHAVIHVLGDAALGMVGMDMETAVRARIGILTVLLNNSAMGGYEAHMPLAVERFGAKELSGNYSEVGRGLGAWTERVERPEEIGSAIRRGLEITSTGQPALIEIITREEPALSRYW